MATMKDVAALAEVDKGTVSRVLKGDPRISAATAERVWEAVRRLGYRPDRLASGLAAGRSGLCAVVLSNPCSWWVGPFLDGFARALGIKSSSLLLVGEGWGRSPLDELLGRRVDGALWMGDLQRIGDELSGLPFPILFWGNRSGAPSIGFHEELLLKGLISSVGQFRYEGGSWSPFSFLKSLEDPSSPHVAWDAAARLAPMPPGARAILGPPLGFEAPKGAIIFPFNPREMGLACGRALLITMRSHGEPIKVSIEIRPSTSGEHV